MYRGFQIMESAKNYFDEYADFAINEVRANEIIVAESLEKFLDPDGVLDAGQLSKEWFPLIKSDVFISHSHNDENYALGMAGWLKAEFGLKTFVDSTVWKSADDLLKKIDGKCCWMPESDQYNYRLRNKSTSHVHMMLAIAIAEMIDRAECLFFLNTPESISPKSTIDEEEHTSSPWIFAEIGFSKLIRETDIPKERRMLVEAMESLQKRDVVVADSVDIVHPLEVEHLDKIEAWNLSEWEAEYQVERNEYPLDILYKMFPRRRRR